MTQALETDVAVIGAGTAGVTAFHAVRRGGRSALLIDHGPLGTTCARVGCMPSKAVLHAAHDWQLARGIAGSSAPMASTADDLWKRAIATRDKLAGGAANRTRAGAGEHLLMGHARFAGPHELDVDGQRVRARAFVVATGSRPILQDSLLGLGDRLRTTDTLFDLPRLPRSLGILGLGAIGLELGLAFSRLGVAVYAGDLRDNLAGIADPAVAARARQRFGSEFTMWLGRPMQVEATAHGVALRSGEDRAEVDLLLAAMGRRPDTKGLGLADAGVDLDAQGAPVLDARTLRGGESSVFFAGDVHPDRALMHEGVDEGLIAARGALALTGAAVQPPPARRTPLSIIFSDPDVAMIGTSWEALEPDSIVVGSAEGTGNGRSRILGAEDNLIRVYADRATGRLLGGSLIATHGEHIGHLLAWAIQRGETVDSLLQMAYYHPSIEEMLQTALNDAARQLATLHT